jgi:hypothetical protein
MVVEVMAVVPLNIGFRWTTTGNKWDSCLLLVNQLIHVNLTNHDDEFKWQLMSNGLFTVKSMYVNKINGHTPFLIKYIWKIKVPLEVQILYGSSIKITL